MDDNVQNIRSGRALKGFGKVLSGLGLVIAAIGAILGGADAGSLSALTAYAEHIGLAFQIADLVAGIGFVKPLPVIGFGIEKRDGFHNDLLRRCGGAA